MKDIRIKVEIDKESKTNIINSECKKNYWHYGG